MVWELLYVLLPVPFSGFKVMWQLLPVPLWVECSCHCWCCSLFPCQGQAWGAVQGGVQVSTGGANMVWELLPEPL